MQRLDYLRISLLASLAGCGASLEDGESDGQTTTSMGTSMSTSMSSGADSSGESMGDIETSTGDEGEMCESGCEGAIELADGIVRCSDGRLNRVSAGTFDPTITAPACEGTETYLECTSDAECDALSISKCIHVDSGPDGETACACTYSCASDSDCFEGQGCFPPGVPVDSTAWPSCRATDCLANSDCGECGECGIGTISDDCGSMYHAIQCRTPADSCAADAECPPGSACFPDMVTVTEPWSCHTGDGCVGRPLLVDAVACTAPPCVRADWAVHASEFEQLPEDPELAAHWAEVAALEHASVASFARFGAQLLALGAPPELVRASKRAALDEIEHARLAYGLASAYGKRAIGPGQLELQGVSMSASWREVVSGLIQEACVGETVGVAEAIAAAESVRMPAVRRVLERIAADELRHAQLAWRSLAHLLREADDADRAWAQALLERTIRAVAGASGSSNGPHRPADGVLGPVARAQVHREASSQVLGPLALALCTALVR